MRLFLINAIRCPSRACPNPDVVKPAWEKNDKDKNSNDYGSVARKRNNLKRKRSRPRSKVKEADKVVESAIAVSESTVMMNRTSSLLRDALLGGPRSVVDSGGGQRRQLVQRPRSDQPPLLQQASSPEGGQRQVIVMLTPTYSTLPTSIALPQTPVPLSQLTASTNNNSVHDNQISNNNGDTLRSVSSMTPPSCSGSSSSSLGTTTSRDDDIMDDLMNIDDSMLFEMMDPKRLSEAATDSKELLSCRPSLTGSPLTLPLLDQSDDPCLNEGDSLSFVTDELDETVQKWMETCDGNFLPI